jgi:hypothetical protein
MWSCIQSYWLSSRALSSRGLMISICAKGLGQRLPGVTAHKDRKAEARDGGDDVAMARLRANECVGRRLRGNEERLKPDEETTDGQDG